MTTPKDESLEEQVIKANRLVLAYCIEIEKIKERMKPTEFERYFREVLEDENVDLNRYWSEKEIKGWPEDKRIYLEEQVKQYKGLKKLILSLYNLMGETMMDFSPDAVFRNIDFNRQAMGNYMENYARLTTFFMAHELITRIKAENLKMKDKDLEFVIADVLSEHFSSGTRFIEDPCGDHSYHGTLKDYRKWSYKIKVNEPNDLDHKYKDIEKLVVIASFDVSSYTDVPNPSLVARSEEELNKAVTSKPQISIGDKIKITFSKQDYMRGIEHWPDWEKTDYFLYNLGPDDPGYEEPNVREINILSRR